MSLGSNMLCLTQRSLSFLGSNPSNCNLICNAKHWCFSREKHIPLQLYSYFMIHSLLFPIIEFQSKPQTSDTLYKHNWSHVCSKKSNKTTFWIKKINQKCKNWTSSSGLLMKGICWLTEWLHHIFKPQNCTYFWPLNMCVCVCVRDLSESRLYPLQIWRKLGKCAVIKCFAS